MRAPPPQLPYHQDRSYQAGAHRIHYVEQAGGPLRILFIHGSPGDWRAWSVFLRDPRLRARASLLAVDRPGWGGSAAGGVVQGLAEQAGLLRPLVAGSGTRTLLVGHSFGGAIAALLALEHPRDVCGAVLVAATLAPELEHPRWYDRLADLPPLRGLLPRRLRLSYQELLTLPGDLRRIEPRWGTLQVPLTLIQGNSDLQVDPRTAEYARRQLPPQLARIVRVRAHGHGILWARPELVVEEILDLHDRSGVTAALRSAPGSAGSSP